MYLQSVHLQNIRSFAELRWELPEGAPHAGWHVILGDNGSGKSTFLRAIAMAFVEHDERAALRQSWEEWLRFDCEEGFVVFWGRRIEGGFESNVLEAGYRLEEVADQTGRALREVEIQPLVGDAEFSRRDLFYASYGPFRRFTGGDNELSKLGVTNPAVARHLSLFGEAIALTEAVTWLQSLKFKKLEGNADGALLDPILAFTNQPGFLPHGTRIIDVTSSGVELLDANGFKMPVQDLSDGYRSVLSMTFELIRQMALTVDPEKLFSEDRTQIVCPGVVLIDEIDAHLHPTWQRTIGIWFRTHFPKVQFLVSTHSPLICQAAEVGSVFRLPRPGADPAEDQGEMLSGIALNRLLYGNVLDAYGSGAFGDGGERSESGQEKLEELAALNVREITSALSEEERAKQEELRAILPTEAGTTQLP
jgi:energy-coupling factor transporter ATP-binding protein EcfA2